MTHGPRGPDVAALAELARIRLSDGERDALAAEVPRIVEYLAAIREERAPTGAAATTEEEAKGPEAAQALAAPLRDLPELSRQAGSGDALRADAVHAFADVPLIRRLFPKTDGERVQLPKAQE